MIWQTSIPIDEDVFALIARATPIGASGGGRDNDDDHRAAPYRLVVKGNVVKRIPGGFDVERYRDSMDRMAGVRSMEVSVRKVQQRHHIYVHDEHLRKAELVGLVG